MIYSMTGNITFKGSDFLCLDVNDIEYELQASLTTITQLPGLGTRVKLPTYLQHREDSMTLYGFINSEEKRIFTELIKVSGIGPKGALKILSGITPADFISVLEREDVTALSKLPGLGKKTAQKILLTLQGKLVSLEEDSQERVPKELLESLQAMGYDKGSIQKAFSQIDLSQNEAEIMRQAIIELSTH